MDHPGLELIEIDGQVFLRCQPQPQRAPLQPAELRDWLVQSGYGGLRMLEDAIARAASDCSRRQEPFEVKLAERCDSVVEVRVLDNDMTVLLELTAPQGGKAAVEADVMAALSKAGVTFGIDSAAIVQVCQQGSCKDQVVARGLAAVHGTDTVFKELMPHVAHREAKHDQDGRIDYREHGSIVVVHAGAPLLRRIAASAGSDGYTVRGRVLGAKRGREQVFAPQLSGVEVASDDPGLLRATLSGQPVRVPCGVMVEPVLHLKQVNMASGNIHFDGTVEVAGEVTQGMKIETSGDIVVNDLVEGAVLRSGGDIRISGGVIGHARLHAHGSVTARFAQGSMIEAGGVITLLDTALDCELEALDQISVGSNAPEHGHLSGGTAIAMMRLSVPILGLDQGGITHVTLGVNHKLEAQHAALLERMAKEKESEERLGKLVKQLTAAGDPKGMLERVNESRKHAMEVWGKSLAEQVELEAEMALAVNAELVVERAVSGAVDLTFGKQSAAVRREFGAGVFAHDSEGHIVFTDSTGIAVAADSLLP